MPWIEVKIMSEKERFVDLAGQAGADIKALCHAFNISRPTGYELLKRHREQGLEGLKPRSRRPKGSPKKTARDIEELILELRDENPSWGGGTIKPYFEQQGISMPSEKTINRILKRYGKVTLEESLKRKAYIRFEHKHPNDLWQMDFKGHFKLKNGESCHPLTLLDDHSRFSLAIVSCDAERFETVKPALINIFKCYGLPKRMTMDNGSPWGYSGSQNHTHLTAWLISQGISVSHSRPYHPQTQGKLERFHRTLKLELLSRYYFDNLEHAQEGFDWWRQMYNYERPHSAIEAYAPGEAYRRSANEYQEEIAPYEFDCGFDVRKVCQKGSISFKGNRYTVGEAFCGHHVGLKPAEEEEIFDVYFHHQRVVKIDLRRMLKY